MTDSTVARLTTVSNLFSDAPALLSPEHVGRVESCLHALAQHPHAIDMLSDMAGEDFWGDSDGWRATLRPYVVKNGVLQIPVKGVLLHDFGYAFGKYATGYKYIQKAFERGINDPDVQGIAFMIDSPGGHVAGCFELVDILYSNRSKKPVRAFAHEHAYSAAYAIASAAKRIVVSRTGGVGSIGVLTMHVDISKALEVQGIKVTLVHAGRHKVDGNQYQPLPDDVRIRMYNRIAEQYEVFVASVARNRGMEELEIRQTEALCFSATEAMSNGLADSIGTLDDALAEFSADLSANTEEDTMSKQETSAVDQAAHEQAVAAARAEGKKEGHAEGLAEGKKAGAAEAQTRMASILGLDEAKDRRASAINFAVKTTLSVEEVKALLADIPADVATAAPAADAATKAFDSAMQNGNPEVG
ncbi:MAG TPA: S49 family peptidase, partial [Rhizobium sp.]|nr:S49 family peptidase [Rhizobium sp.]